MRNLFRRARASPPFLSGRDPMVMSPARDEGEGIRSSARRLECAHDSLFVSYRSSFAFFFRSFSLPCPSVSAITLFFCARPLFRSASQSRVVALPINGSHASCAACPPRRPRPRSTSRPALPPSFRYSKPDPHPLLFFYFCPRRFREILNLNRCGQEWV